MARAITSPELALLRSTGQWTRLYLAVLKPNTVYTARLAALPASNDQVAEISYNTGSGTLADVQPGMTLLVGTTAGARDLGVCRIRTAPDGSKIYIGETSEIEWASSCYLTITDDFDLWARHVHVDDNEYLYMDYNITYTDEHESFHPVPVLGTHACLWLTGATVSVGFDASDSWVFDSTISAYAWSAPGSSASSGMTSATPTITYNAAGIYRVLCTVTAANGKTSTGARYVFVYDDDNPPSTVFQLANCEGNVDMGGWMFDVTMQAEAGLADLREGTLVVLFARDTYEGTEQSIGPIAGRENIVCVGRVGPSESIRWDPVAGQVHFTVYGPQYFMNKIKVSACQLEFTSGAPANWNQVKNLTVDRALYHLMYWRSTATIIMDFNRTGDTLYDNKIATLANFLWSQLNEFAGLKLMAHVLCDRFGRLYCQVDPQMVQDASRSSFPEVMTVTEQDWMDVIELERTTVFETAQVNISTRLVNTSGVSYTLYSLSPGHMPRRHGDWEINDGMLAGSQADSNHKAGLLLGWKNNPYPDFPIRLAQNNRMLDITPYQVLSLTIDAADTPRGISFSGHIIPRRVAFRYDADARWLSTELICEAETFEQATANGDIPGSGDVDPSIPPLPPLPPLPDLPPILPGGTGGGPSASGPTVVVMHDASEGLLYSTNFGDASPTWNFFNAGLTNTQKSLVNRFFRTPSGACYCGYVGNVFTGSGGTGFVARAPSLGGTWTVLFSVANLNDGANRWGITGMGYNPVLSETVALVLVYAANEIPKLYVGNNTTWTGGANVSSAGQIQKRWLSYGLGKWMITTSDEVKLGNADGSAVANASVTPSLGTYDPPHLRASTTGRTYHPYLSPTTSIVIADNNHASRVFEDTVSAVAWFDNFYSDLYIDCDPSGVYLMSRWGAGARGRSSDSGYTWGTISALPVGNYWFAYAGPGSSAPRFVAAGGSVVRYSPDFGNTWSNKEGTLTGLIPLPNINMVKVLVY